MKRILLLITIALTFCVFLTYSQTRKERVSLAKTQINVFLASYSNGPYQAGEIVDVDSSIGVRRVADGKIANPYGTLNRCYLFTAKAQGGDGKHTVGVYRDNQIIWMSEQLSGSQDYGDLDDGFLATQDLNKTGKVDIVVFFSDGTIPPSEYYLWIFSWDGSQGICINQRESDGGTSINSNGTFEIFDVDADGVNELVSVGSNYKANSVYSWNGSLYGEWPNSPDITGRSHTIANNLTAIVHATVAREGNKFKYSYEVTNTTISKQKIQSFYVKAVMDTIDSVKVPSSWSGGQWAGYPMVDCFTENENDQIDIGHILRTFSFDCRDLPTLSTYYVQGPNYELDYSTQDPDTLMRIVYNNVLNNSYNNFTVSFGNIPTPFIPLNFLDTLIGYTTQSHSLGWIKDQTTVNKYLSNFNSAKTSLQQNNIISTRATLNQVLQDANVDSTTNITSEAYALIRYNTEYLLAQLPAPVSGCNVKLINSTGAKLTGGSLQYYEGAWKDAINNNDGTFFVNTTAKTISLRMTYEYGTQTKSNVAVTADTVAFQTVNVQIKLQDSKGNSIDTGSVQYYAGAWRTLGTTINGMATKELLPVSYSFRMTYAYASKDKQQDLSNNPVVVFQTVKAIVQLQNSQGALMDQGTIQYYSGAWRDFGTTTNGVANKELLPNNYSFRMTYAYASKDKQQDISTNPTVVFQTVNAAVQLQNSQGGLMPAPSGDQGVVQYYSGAWRDFGTTSNGVANKELLPNNYSFRMTYAYASKDKQQDLSSNPVVVFQTVKATVQLQNSQGTLIDQGTVQYYSGAWRDFGATTNGVASKELLPNNHSFRMTYEYVSLDKAQDLSVNSTVSFSTVLCTIRVKNSQSQPVDGALASYYSGAWRQIGTTVNGEVTKELLPVNLTFRIKYGTQQQDKAQNLSTNNVVEFSVQ